MKKYIYSLLGDYYHEHDLSLNALMEAVKPFGGEVELIDFELEQLSGVIAKKPSLIIINKGNYINPQDEIVDSWLIDELDIELESYVRQGGSLIAWHAALSSYPEDSRYINMLRGSFIHHPPENRPVRYFSNANLPFEDRKPFEFEVLDEHYFVKCDEKDTNVFLMSTSEDGESIAGWNHAYGEGCICCITPTHRKEGLTNREMLRLLYNAIKWCIE